MDETLAANVLGPHRRATERARFALLEELRVGLSILLIGVGLLELRPIHDGSPERLHIGGRWFRRWFHGHEPHDVARDRQQGIAVKHDAQMPLVVRVSVLVVPETKRLTPGLAVREAFVKDIRLPDPAVLRGADHGEPEVRLKDQCSPDTWNSETSCLAAEHVEERRP